MDKIEELKIKNLQDSWSMLYMCIAKEVIDQQGIAGESALRAGIREFGYDRSRNLVKRHKELGLKLNMENLFTYGDLPGDPRFKRERIALNPQERISNTLVCPIADMWKRNNATWIGRIYCEEFHHACYGSYAPHVQVNLSKTLTEKYDDHCSFAVYLRPGAQNSTERVESFAEYDQNYVAPDLSDYTTPGAKEGFNKLSIKIIYHLYKSLKKNFGVEIAEKIMSLAIINYLKLEVDFLKTRAEMEGNSFNAEYIRKNSPLGPTMQEDAYWLEEYSDKELLKIMDENYYHSFQKII